MPKVTWTELNDQVHDFKNTLVKIHGVELIADKVIKDAGDMKRMCRKLKRSAIKQLSEMHRIILEQAENGKKGVEK